MAKKNPKPGEEPKFVVKKRIPKDKPNFFQNIPDIKSRLSHPLAEVFDFRAPDDSAASDLDSQTLNIDISKDGLLGKPNQSDLDSPNNNIGYPNITLLDSQITGIGYPNVSETAIQIENSGYPKGENLDSNIAKNAVWLAKNPKSLESLASNLAASENLDSQKFQKKGKWKKYDVKRSTASVFIRADEELVNEIKHFNVERKLDMREFFELSARRFIDSFGLPNDGDLASNIALDDKRLMIMYKTTPSIINLFREYNRILTPDSEWKPKDDAVGVKYNDVDLRIIEIGIIITQSNLIENESDTKISRFKYYTREIDKAAALGFNDQMLAVMIQTYRKRWREISGREVNLNFFTGNEGK